MKLENLPGEDERSREPKPGEYTIPTSNKGHVVGQVVCVTPGLKLVDFYRTSTVLAKDVPPLPPLPKAKP